MPKQEIFHPDRPDTARAPYSSAVLCDGWLYVSGQGPLDLKTMQVKRGSIAEETRTTLENVRQILEAARCSFDDVVKSTCHLADINDFDEFSKTYTEYFKQPRPARTTVASGLWGGMKIEIDVVARVPKNKDDGHG